MNKNTLLLALVGTIGLASPALYGMAPSRPMPVYSVPKSSTAKPELPVDRLRAAQALSRVSRRGPGDQSDQKEKSARTTALQIPAIRQLITAYLNLRPWSLPPQACTMIHLLPPGSQDGISIVAASNDGQYCAVVYGDHEIAIFNMQDRTLVRKCFHKSLRLHHGIRHLTFSADNRFLIAEECDLRYDFDTHIQYSCADQRYQIVPENPSVIVDNQTGIATKLPGLNPHPNNHPVATSMCPTGKYIAARLNDWEVGLWDKQNFSAQPIKLPSFSKDSDCGAPVFSPDGQYLLTHDRRVLKCWNLKKIDERKAKINNLMEHLFIACKSEKRTRRNIRKIVERRSDAHSWPVKLIRTLHEGNIKGARAHARIAYKGSQSVGTNYTFNDFTQNQNHQNTVFSIAAHDECDFLETPPRANLAERVKELLQEPQEEHKE